MASFKGRIVNPLDRVVARLDEVERLVRDLARAMPRLNEQLGILVDRFGACQKQFLRVDEVAELTGRSAFTVRRWIKEGKIEATRISHGGPRGRLLIPRHQLQCIVRDGKGENVPDATLGLN